MRLLQVAWAWVVLNGLFLREFVLSVKDVALTVLWPSRTRRSAILAVPLDIKSDAGITLLASLITLTPGTISLHVSDDRSILYIHVMNATDATVQQIKAGFERRVMDVLP